MHLPEGHDPRAFVETLLLSAERTRPRHGALGAAGACIALPDGRRFVGVYYRGDIRRWRIALTRSCAARGLPFARSLRGKFVVGQEAPLPIKDLKIDLF